jgi:hypothetical protein
LLSGCERPCDDLPAISPGAYHWRITVSETAGMKKFWKWIAGWSLGAKIWAGFVAVSLLAIDRYFNEISVKELADRFALGAKAWLMQSVSFALVWLIIVAAVIVLSFSYIALLTHRRRIDEENSKAALSKVKPKWVVSEEQRHFLKIVADATNAGVPLTLKTIFDFAGMDQVNFDHARYELEKNFYIQTYNHFQKGRMIQLNEAGLKYVVDHDLAHKKIVSGFGVQRSK